MERQIKVTIRGEQKIVKFPNVGQLLDIESMKQGLTNNAYGALARSATAMAYLALDIVDMIAFFKVMLPGLAKEINVQNYTEADMDQIRDLVQVYKKDISPWFDKTLLEISGVTDADSGKKTDEQGED